MQPIEIIVVILSVAIMASVIICSIIRKKRGKTGCGCDCADCAHCSACRSGKSSPKATGK